MKGFFFTTIGILICCFTSCEKRESKEKIEEGISPAKSYFEDFNNDKKIRELSAKIAEKGDTLAYNELKEIYFFSSHTRDFLRNSLLMANNFDYPEAYFDVYFILKDDLINGSNVKSNKLANFYLLKSKEKGVQSAESIVKERFGGLSTLPKANDYWLEINR